MGQSWRHGKQAAGSPSSLRTNSACFLSTLILEDLAKFPSCGVVGGWRVEGAEREKYMNASKQLQFAGRASERTTRQQGARQPPEAVRSAEHSAGGDAPWCTWASLKPRGFAGPGSDGKAWLSLQTCGGEADLPSPPPQQTGSPSGQHMSLQAEHAPGHWSMWAGVSYRQTCVWRAKLPIKQAAGPPCATGMGRFESRVLSRSCQSFQIGSPKALHPPRGSCLSPSAWSRQPPECWQSCLTLVGGWKLSFQPPCCAQRPAQVPSKTQTLSLNVLDACSSSVYSALSPHRTPGTPAAASPYSSWYLHSWHFTKEIFSLPTVSALLLSLYKTGLLWQKGWPHLHPSLVSLFNQSPKNILRRKMKNPNSNPPDAWHKKINQQDLPLGISLRCMTLTACKNI